MLRELDADLPCREPVSVQREVDVKTAGVLLGGGVGGGAHRLEFVEEPDARCRGREPRRWTPCSAHCRYRWPPYARAVVAPRVLAATGTPILAATVVVRTFCAATASAADAEPAGASR